jgi:hypothetical protein
MELEPRPDEVTVIQYLRPFGKPSKVFAPVGEEYVAKAKGMILSAEVLRTGEVMVYARWADEAEEKEINELAVNKPSLLSDFIGPTAALQRLIDRKLAEKCPYPEKTCEECRNEKIDPRIDSIKAAQKTFGVKP